MLFETLRSWYTYQFLILLQYRTCDDVYQIYQAILVILLRPYILKSKVFNTSREMADRETNYTYSIFELF